MGIVPWINGYLGNMSGVIKYGSVMAAILNLVVGEQWG